MTELTESRASVAGFEPGTPGVTPPSDPDRRGAFLSDVIVELGMVDGATAEMAEQTARGAGKSIETVLLEGGALDERQLARAMAERSGLDHVDLDELDVDMQAAEMIGRRAAQRYNMAPIAFASDGALIVASPDAFDSLGVGDIEAITRSEVRRAIAAPSQIEALIGRLPEEPSAKPMPEQFAPHPATREADAPQPEPEPDPAWPVPEPDAPRPAPELDAARPATELDAEQSSNADLGELSNELQTLLATARNAEALATGLGDRIQKLEGAEERADQLERQQSGAAERIAELERELAGARERVADLERSLDRVNGATEKLKAANEVLLGLQQVLEESAP